MAEWISVKDRLPEKEKLVLCCKNKSNLLFIGKCLDATYAEGVQAFVDVGRWLSVGVTHWMPLPEPPKGE